MLRRPGDAVMAGGGAGPPARAQLGDRLRSYGQCLAVAIFSVITLDALTVYSPRRFRSVSYPFDKPPGSNPGNHRHKAPVRTWFSRPARARIGRHLEGFDVDAVEGCCRPNDSLRTFSTRGLHHERCHVAPIAGTSCARHWYIGASAEQNLFRPTWPSNRCPASCSATDFRGSLPSGVWQRWRHGHRTAHLLRKRS